MESSNVIAATLSTTSITIVDEVAALKFEMNKDEERLKDVEENATNLKLAIDDSEKGRSSIDSEVLREKMKELATAKVELMMSMRKKRSRLESLTYAEPATVERASSTRTKRYKSASQLTLDNFFKVIKDGHIHDLEGPKVISTYPRSIYQCLGCKKSFGNQGALGTHRNSCREYNEFRQQLCKSRSNSNDRGQMDHDGDGTEVDSEGYTGDEKCEEDINSQQSITSTNDGKTTQVARKDGRCGASKRKSYTFSFQQKVIDTLDALKLEKVNAPIVTTAQLFGIHESLVSKWSSSKGRERIQCAQMKLFGKYGRRSQARVLFRCARGPRPSFPLAEAYVFAKFEIQREQGLRVTTADLRRWMNEGMKENYPSITIEISASWTARFMKRNCLVVRRPTNKKKKSAKERVGTIQKFHSSWQKHISSGVQQHEVFGRYLPSCLINVDQSPLTLAPIDKTTIDVKGAEVVRVATRTNGEKRYCTLQICIALCGNKENPSVQPRISVVFRGKGCVTNDEKEKYHPLVDVYFQSNAWMDENVLLEWTEKTLKQYLTNLPDSPKVLFLDNLKCHTSETFKGVLKDLNVRPWYFPSNMTDLIQPVDQNIAVDIKRRIARQIDDRISSSSDFANKWFGNIDTAFTAKDIRILLTNIIGDVWSAFVKEKDFIEVGFTTGCLMPVIGKEASVSTKIKIQGIDDYSFAHVSEHDMSDFEEVDKQLESVLEGITSLQVEEEIVEDMNVHIDDFVGDDTRDETEGAGPPCCPGGYEIVEKPTEFPVISTLIGSMVLWSIPARRSGKPGWIMSKIVGGPPSPADKMRGISLVLACSCRIDANTPESLVREKGTNVGFTLNNYGAIWILLKKADPSSN